MCADSEQDNQPGQNQRRVALYTLGCKINQYDSNSIIAGLKQEGHICLSEMSEAEVIVINTCTVTGRTDYKGRQQIRKAIKGNPGAVIIVTGCYAQVQPESLAEIPGVDYILGNTEKSEIAALISRSAKQKSPQIRVGDIFESRSMPPEPPKVHSGTTRAFLKVQDGCNHACSYCIIPRARGRSRSLAPSHVWKKVHTLAESGFQEIILSGIHLGLYGMDLEPPFSLRGLLKELEEKAALPRIRISSIEPRELTKDILLLFANAQHLCPHFHLPLQSGDPCILKSMRRPYTSSYFATLVRSIREQIPEASIGVDVIAGFPGEDEASFLNTMEFLKSLPVSYFHVFPFSPRPGTPAASFPGQVQPELIHKRARLLRKLGQEKRLAFYRQFLDQEVEVLVETKRDPATGLLKGTTRNYLPVLFDGEDDLQRKRVMVMVREVRPGRIMGDPVM